MDRLRWILLPVYLVVTLFLSLAFFASPAEALMLKLSLQQLADGADSAVVGTVVERTSRWNADHTRIETLVTISVEETLKGTPGNTKVTITVPGGEVGGITQQVSDTPRFQLGERSVVFLKQLPGKIEVYGHYQGKFNIEKDRVNELSLAEFKQQVSQAVKGARTPTSGTAGWQPGGTVRLDVPNSTGAPPLAQPPAYKDGWQNIMTEYFDTFPSAGWSISTNTGAVDAKWGKTDYTGNGGSGGIAWCARDGTAGMNPSSNPSGYLYPNNMSAWMIFGGQNGFSLSDATQAELSFSDWVKTQFIPNVVGPDYIKVGFSTDTGTNKQFYLLQKSTVQEYWANATFDLGINGLWASSPLGDLRGKPALWLAFSFTSDTSGQDKGAFIDNVVLRKYVSTSPTPQITGINPSTASAGTNSQVTITGTNFGATQGTGAVNFYYQGQAVIAGSIISWSDTSIVTTVPTATLGGYPASAGSGPVYVQTSTGSISNSYPFTVTFSYGGIKWAGTSPVVGFKVNPGTLAGAEIAVQNAAATWTAVPNKNFAFNYTGASNATQATQNSINEIMWLNLGNTSTLAQAWTTWNAFNNITETDIEFNTNFSWSTAATPPAGVYDVETVAVHELGHWLNLRDLYGNVQGYPSDSAKIMYGFGTSGTTKRVLHADDKAGIVWIYPRSEPAVTTNAASNITANSARLNGELTAMGTASTVNVSFMWGTISGNLTTETSPAQPKTTPEPFFFDLNGLNPGVTYYYKAKAVGTTTVYGTETSFVTTVTPPSVTTNDATNITGFSARLNGDLTALGTASPVNVSFMWGTATGNLPNGTSPFEAKTAIGIYDFNLTGLSPGSTYYYKAKAVGHGTVFGTEKSFSTATVTPPAVATSDANQTTLNSARLNGDLTVLGSTTPVNVSFLWGTTTGNLPNETSPSQAMTAIGTFNFNLTGLNSSTTYFYKAKAVGSTTVYGEEKSFKTALTVGINWVEYFTATAPSARSRHTITDVGGKLLLFGGMNGLLNDTWEWERLNRIWKRVTPVNDPPPARHSHGAAKSGDKLYIFFGESDGGTVLNDVWSYNPSTSQWTQEVQNGTELPSGRSNFTCTSLPDGKIAMFGGNTAPDAYADRFLWTYDPATATWVKKASMTGVPRSGHSMTYYDGALYVWGGNTPDGKRNDMVKYTLASDTWEPKNPTAGEIPSARSDHASASWGNLVWVFGGKDSDNATFSDTWVFDFTTYQWKKQENMPAPVSDGGVVAFIGGSTDVLFFGGLDSNGQKTGRTFIYKQPEGTTNVDISVVLQGGARPDPGWVVPITIKYFTPGADVLTAPPVYTHSLTTAKAVTSPNLATCQSIGVVTGTYDITAVSPHTLMNVKRGVIIYTNTAINLGTLLDGNADNNELINILDFGALAVSYNKADGDTGYNPMADFDRNGRVTILDFGLMALNYQKTTPVVVP